MAFQLQKRLLAKKRDGLSDTRKCHLEGRSPGESGFSVLELATAVAIMAIIALATLPMLTNFQDTYRLRGAAQQVIADLRYAQGVAISRGGIVGLHNGGDPLVNKANQYRIERSTTGLVGTWPATSDTPTSNANVITDWTNLGTGYPGVTIASFKDNNNLSVTYVMFNSLAASVNPLTGGFANPVTVTLSNPSGNKQIQTKSNGSIKIQ